jgi:hypothetical protein
MRRGVVTGFLGALLAGGLAAQRPADDSGVVLASEMGRVRERLVEVTQRLRERTDELETTQREVRGMARELDGLKERLSGPIVAAPFLAAPPPSSDTAGIAKTAVLAPKIDIDAPGRHDLVFFKLARIETGGVRVVAERELSSAEYSLELPIDQNGALYVVSWTTAEGYTFPLVLRDGASGQTAATTQVKQLQREGRFVFVGYRVE